MKSPAPDQLNYRIRESSGPWIVFLHGIQSNREIFDSFFFDQRFSKVSLLAVDFIGFRRTIISLDFNYDLKSQADAITDLLVTLNIQEASIVGHSMGGMVGTLLLDSKKISIDGFINLEGNLTLADCGRSAKVAKIPKHEFQKEHESYIGLLSVSSNEVEQIRAHFLQLIPANVFYQTSKSIVNWAASGQLLSLYETSSTPKLLIFGKNSSYQSRPTGKQNLSAFIPEAGHFMFLEDFETTASETIRFIESLK